MENYPKPVSQECHKTILAQLDNSIYQIKEKGGKCEIGFFCSIKYNKNEIIHVLVTTYQFVNETFYKNINCVDVLINNEYISIEFGSFSHINKEYDLGIIEIKEEEIKNYKYYN